MPSVLWLPAAERPAVPWKNGQGVTWQVTAQPPGAETADFDWRVSIAEISVDGAFSAFPGVERTIAVIDGAGIDLSVEGTSTVLAPFLPFDFAGEADTSCRLVDGTTRDLNLMTNRRRAQGSMEFVYLGSEPSQFTVTDQQTCVFVLAAGSVRLSTHGERRSLKARDAVLVDGPALCAVTGDGSVLAIIRVTPIEPGKRFVARS